MKILFAFSISFLSINLPVFSQETIIVTYIANEGFLVTSGDKKILFDGIFSNGSGKFYTPTAEALINERNAASPFDNIDILFNSHNHADHIDPNFILEHLGNNSNATLIAPRQSADDLSLADGFDTLQKRIRAIPRANHSRFDTTINDIGLEAYSFTHANGNTSVQNIGYIANLNGFTLFHSGDSDPEILDTFQLYSLSEKNIDLAFFHRGFFDAGDNSTGEQIINYLHPKAIIIMHIKIGDFEEYRQKVASYSGIPKVYFMEEQMGTLEFIRDGDSLKLKDDVNSTHRIKTDNNDFVVYPNPTNGFFIVSFGSFSKYKEVTIYSRDGRVIKSNKVENSSEMTIDLTSYPEGLYFIKITDNNSSCTKNIFYRKNL